MKVNNYQPNFKSASFDKNALKVISDRVPAGQFDSIIESFKNKYKDSKFDIIIGVLPEKHKRLDAMISYNVKSLNENEIFFRHIEEGFFKSFFSSPKNFLKKVSQIYEKEAIPFAENGYRYLA